MIFPFASKQRAMLGISLLVGMSVLFGGANAQALQQRKAYRSSKRTHRIPPQPLKKAVRPTPPYPVFHTVSGLERYIESVEAKFRASHPKEAEKEKAQENGKGRKSESKEKEELGLDYLEAYLYRMKLRAYPRDRVDWGAYPRAARHRNRMPAARIGKAGKLGGINLLGVSVDV